MKRTSREVTCVVIAVLRFFSFPPYCIKCFYILTCFSSNRKSIHLVYFNVFVVVFLNSQRIPRSVHASWEFHYDLIASFFILYCPFFWLFIA